MIKRDQIAYYSSYLIAEEAQKKGIKVNRILEDEYVFKSAAFVELSYKNHKEVIIGQKTSKTTVIGHKIQENKLLAKHFLNQNNIETPNGKLFYIKDIDKIRKYCKKASYPLVIKPLSSIQGICVFVNIKNLTQVEEAISELKKNNFETALIENQFIGKEYRILATREKFLAAIYRIPANVIGDGKRSIKKLIDNKNKDPRRGDGHEKSLVKIKIDNVVKNYLKENKLTLNTVPKNRERIFLRSNSNLSTGGDSIDVTDEINPAVKKLSVKIIRSIPGLAYGGIDYMTKDIKKAPSKGNYAVIEINDSPMISMHHIPYKGKKRNIAGKIIDMIFPEVKK